MLTFTDEIIGAKLFHQYLGDIIVTSCNGTSIFANCGVKGILEFKDYDFGKVLFMEKRHSSIRTFNSYNEYNEFLLMESLDNMKKKAESERELEEIRKRNEENKEKELLSFIEEEQRRANELHLEMLKKQDKFKIEEAEKSSEQKTQATDNLRESNKLYEIRKVYCTREYIDAQKNKLQTDKSLIQDRNTEKAMLRQILESRGIKSFVHFTRIDNLKGILERGLVPVLFHEIDNIETMFNDEQRIDSKLDCTSFSIEFPNYRLFSRFRNYKFPGQRWAVISVMAEVIFSQDNISYFYHSNAAGTKTFPDGQFTAEALENMFCESLITKKGKVIYRSNLDIEDNMTTDPQAEVLISHTIDKSYISNISFCTLEDFSYFTKRNKQEFMKNFSFEVNPELFSTRNDSNHW